MKPIPFSSAEKPKLGISACLMGAQVRYNGGHKESRLCTRELSEYFDFVPVCPEVAIGLDTPREPIRLVGDPHDPRAVGTVNPALDVTGKLAAYAERMVHELDGICGYIFMHKSPSCGLERVKVYRDNGVPSSETGSGVYAGVFSERRPELPLEEDGRLNDAVLRENFITRVFAYHAWQQLLAKGLSRRALTEFHSRYKYQLMANDPAGYKALGPLLGSMGRIDAERIAPLYFRQLMTSLRKPATRRTHTNVLQHLSGYLKQTLGTDDKQEMQHVISQYHQGIVPLVVPLTLFKHHFRHHPDPYVAIQVYLQPHPENLSLRNAI